MLTRGAWIAKALNKKTMGATSTLANSPRQHVRLVLFLNLSRRRVGAQPSCCSTTTAALNVVRIYGDRSLR